MLKLTVEVGESLLIGDDIKVIFTGGTSNYARVLVEAPKYLPIVRSSLVEKAERKGNSNTAIKKNGIYPRRQRLVSMQFLQKNADV